MNDQVRTTILLSEDLRLRARHKCLEQGKSFSQVVRELLKEWLEEEEQNDEEKDQILS